MMYTEFALYANYPALLFNSNLSTINPMRNTIVKYPNKLREFRKAKRLNQHQVTSILGQTYDDQLSRWEKGTAVPHLINLLKLCDLYNANLKDLYPTLPQEVDHRLP